MNLWVKGILLNEAFENKKQGNDHKVKFPIDTIFKIRFSFCIQIIVAILRSNKEIML